MSNPFIIRQSQKFISETKPTKEQQDKHNEYIHSRTLRILEAFVMYSHMKQKDVEKELGYKKSYLTKLFDGDIELRVDHVSSICYMLEFPASVFWQIVYEDEVINLDQFDNGLARRMKGLLIYIYGSEPNKLADALGYVMPTHRQGDI